MFTCPCGHRLNPSCGCGMQTQDSHSHCDFVLGSARLLPGSTMQQHSQQTTVKSAAGYIAVSMHSQSRRGRVHRLACRITSQSMGFYKVVTGEYSHSYYTIYNIIDQV